MTDLIYSNWKWPEVTDLHAFEGDLIHTANWPEDFDAAGKVVAVIGNGSTGIQVVPELQKSKSFPVLLCQTSSANEISEAEKLYHLFRTPTWVTPPRIMAWKMMGQNKQLLEVLSEIGIDDQENFSEETIAKFKSDPEFYRRFVKVVEKEVNNGFAMVRHSRPTIQ